MKALLKLIRLPNLLIIILTLILVRYCVLQPLLEAESIALQFSNLNFILVLLSTVLIAGGGYIINDFLDLKIDEINKKSKIIIGNKIKKKTAIVIYVAFNTLALVFSVEISLSLGSLKYLLVPVFIIFMLLFYSARYKKQILIGNIIIAFFSAFVIIAIGLIEIIALGNSEIITSTLWEQMKLLLFGYSIFAFIVSLIREIIKDTEDIAGDKMQSCKTIPIVLGIFYTKIIIVSLIILTMGLLAYGQFLLYDRNLDLMGTYFFLVQLLFVFLIYKIIAANEKPDFKFSGNVSKIIMVSGILSMLILLI